MPLTSVNFLISYTLQAMGKGVQSAALTFSRQGLLNIPLLLLMNALFGLYGMIWTQLRLAGTKKLCYTLPQEDVEKPEET